MRDFRYTKRKKAEIAARVIPAIVGIGASIYGLWKTARQCGEDIELSRIARYAENEDAYYATEKATGIKRRYYSEVVED